MAAMTVALMTEFVYAWLIPTLSLTPLALDIPSLAQVVHWYNRESKSTWVLFKRILETVGIGSMAILKLYLITVNILLLFDVLYQKSWFYVSQKKFFIQFSGF